MITSPIPTNSVADRIRDWLIDQYDLGLIDKKIFDRRFAAIRKKTEGYSKLLLEGINYADNETVGFLRIESQAILWMPPGQTELLLTTYRDFIQEFAIPKIPKEEILYQTDVYLMHYTSFADVGSINSPYIHYYSSMPIGKAKPAGKYRLADFDRYEERDSHYDKEGLDLAYYDPSAGRLRLPNPAGKDGQFLSFTAFVKPGVITDYSRISSYDDYMVRTPANGRNLLEHHIKEWLIPENSELHDRLIQKRSIEEQRSLSHMDIASRTIEMDTYV